MCTLLQALHSAQRGFEVKTGPRQASKHLTINQEPKKATSFSLLSLSSNGKEQETDNSRETLVSKEDKLFTIAIMDY